METPKLSPAKINPTKLLPGISISEKKISTQNLQEESISVFKSDLFIIKKQVFKVRDLIQTSTLIKQSELEKKRKSTEKKEAEKQENKLEAKPEEKKDKLKMPSMPKLGFLDRIKNFLFSVLLGYISIKLLPHLPKLVGIVKIIGNVMEFMIDLGGNILDKVVTFIDWGYKAIDATRGFMKSFGGDFSLKIFDTFTGTLSGVIDAAIIASIAIAGQGKDGVLDIGMDLVKDRLLGQGAKTAAQAGTQAATGAGGTAAGGGATAGGTAAQAGGIGTGAVAAIILGAGLLASALGEGAFQLKKMSVGMEQGAKKAYDGEKNPLMKPIRWLMYQGAKFISFQLGTVGTLLDIVGTPFRYAIELIRYPFLDEKGKEAQSKNLAKFDARIREQFREGLNALTFGLVGGGGEGSFGSLFGDKGTKGMGYAKQAEGGPAPVTRGNKIVGGAVKRTISRKPVKRGVKVQVTKVKPGGSIGGKKKIEKIFPEVPTKDKGKNVNPLGYMQSSYNIATKTPSFGALFALPLKAQLGEKPSSVDYMKAAEELSGWMQNTFRGTAGYAGGGKVEAGMFGGDDTTNVIAKSLEENISSKVDAAIKELQKQLMLKEGEKKSDDKKTGPDAGAMGTGEYSPEGLQGEIYKYLLSKGMDDIHAIGLMANISRESGFRPGIDEIGGGGGVGLFQYTSEPRKGNFLKAVPDYKTNWKGQIDYALKEPGEPAPQWLAMKFSSPQEAADWFMINWERPREDIQSTLGPKEHKEYIASLEKYKSKTGKGYNLPSADIGSKGNAVQYVTGDVNYKGDGQQFYYDLAGHGLPGNYHDHIAFATIADKEVAKKKLRAAGIEIGSEYKGRERSPGYHGKNLAFDVPGGQWGGSGAIGQKEFAGSRKVRQVLGIGAYLKGGRVTKPTLATLAEDGRPEFIFDADTTKGLDFLAPNLLEYLNAAKTKSQLMSVLQSYAGYEDGAEQTVIVMNSPQMIPIPIPTGNSGSIGGMSRSSSIDTTYDTQYANA
jgi:hypothetical protein